MHLCYVMCGGKCVLVLVCALVLVSGCGAVESIFYCCCYCDCVVDIECR